jgi:hypothetical protein
MSTEKRRSNQGAYTANALRGLANVWSVIAAEMLMDASDNMKWADPDLEVNPRMVAKVLKGFYDEYKTEWKLGRYMDGTIPPAVAGRVFDILTMYEAAASAQVTVQVAPEEIIATPKAQNMPLSLDSGSVKIQVEMGEKNLNKAIIRQKIFKSLQRKIMRVIAKKPAIVGMKYGKDGVLEATLPFYACHHSFRPKSGTPSSLLKKERGNNVVSIWSHGGSNPRPPQCH